MERIESVEKFFGEGFIRLLVLLKRWLRDFWFMGFIIFELKGNDREVDFRGVFGLFFRVFMFY